MGEAETWPNSRSQANSDEWLIENHDQIRLMRPRVLVLNFVNELSPEAAMEKAEWLCRALRESSRWHGYQDPAAPVFLDYQIAKVADLRDPAPRDDLPDRNSSLFPRASDGSSFDHAALFSTGFALHYGFEEPSGSGRYLDLKALVDRGIIHEVWFLIQHTRQSAAWETVEVKQTYDEHLRKRGHTFDAGNSGPHGAPWIGRSLRILFFNFERGIGCAMESLGHSLEHMATCGAIPYFTRYFTEYAMLDLDRRFGLPFNSLYAKGPAPVAYPTPTTLAYGKSWWWRSKLRNYVCAGGNVHFAPNGRYDYDMENDAAVLSTVQHWRSCDAPDGADTAELWSPRVLERYRELAPDCMGRWVVYWRQNMPGLANKARDDDGRPMKNWWPFLFY